MKRRTNLFYNDNSIDTNFLTFSNFTEHLTGVFLATNYKMWPCRFLCFNIPKLNKEWAEEEYSNELNIIYDRILNEYCENKEIEDKDSLDINVISSLQKQAETELNKRLKTYDEEEYENEVDDVYDRLVDEYLEMVNSEIEDNEDEEEHKRVEYRDLDDEILDEIENRAREEVDYYVNNHITIRTSRQEFTEDYLVGYYENKLAFCRDEIVNGKYQISDSSEKPKQVDEIIPYLGWLVDTIIKYDKNSTLTFQSTITEQNFNGTFTDIICTISSEKQFGKVYDIKNINETERITGIEVRKDSIISKYLYGWGNTTIDGSYEYVGPPSYSKVKPVFDGSVSDQSFIYNIPANHILPLNEELQSDTVSFNIVVPLYAITNMDFNTNNTEVKEVLADIDTSITESDSHANNVPYGIWFAGEEITLSKDTGSNYAPSWSLLIGTQFKPFPTSKYVSQDLDETQKNKIESEAFVTFAEILSKQTNIYEKLNNLYIEQKEKIDNALEEIDDKLKQINMIYDNLNTILGIDRIIKIKEELEEYLRMLKEGDELTVKPKWTYDENIYMKS